MAEGVTGSGLTPDDGFLCDILRRIAFVRAFEAKAWSLT